MSGSDLYKLPHSWKWTTLGETGQLITGNTPPKKNPDNYGDYIPFVKPPELEDLELSDSKDSLSDTGAKLGRILPPNSVLVSCIGNLGKTGFNKVPVAFNQQINSIIFPEDINSKYGFYYCQTLKKWLYGVSSATTLPIVNKSKFQLAPIPIPPLNEQNRIVLKIEELFTKLDAGIQELTLAKNKLRIYRQSVLKHAFEGKLTEKWREAHKGEINSFSSDIQQDSANSLNFSGLPEIPAEWSWALLGELGELNRGKSKHRPRNDERLFGGKYPFIQTSEVKNSKGLITDYMKTYSDFGLEQSKLWPKGTLCITIAANIAETAILGIEACFPDSVVGFVPKEEICDMKYINFFIKNIKNRIQAYAPATAQKNINLTILRKISVPLPSLNEQKLIVNEIEQSYSISENMERTIDISISKSKKLRQSILKKAFSGQLVHQDPKDEPAEKLLKRIKAEKEKQKPKRTKKKSKQKRLVK